MISHFHKYHQGFCFKEFTDFLPDLMKLEEFFLKSWFDLMEKAKEEMIFKRQKTPKQQLRKQPPRIA